MIAAAIPIFNEEQRIDEVLKATRELVDLVLVVDDGSTDAGADVAAKAGAKVIRHAGNQGKGAALQTALAWAREQSSVQELVLLDGDGQHNPSDIPRLLTKLREEKLDIVVGSRFLGSNDAPLYRLFGLHVLSASAALGSGVHISDSQSGFRALSRRAIDALELRATSFSVESEMQFDGAEKGLRFGEIPIQIVYAGPARRSPIVHGTSVLLQTIKMTILDRPARLPLLVATPFIALRISRTRRLSVE